MTVSFCGHADFRGTAEQEGRVLTFLENTIGDEAGELYLGGYGGFDGFAYACCKKIQGETSKRILGFCYAVYDAGIPAEASDGASDEV